MNTLIVMGVLGQDRTCLAKLLFEQGSKVYRAYRLGSSANTWRLGQLGVDCDVEMVPLELLEYSNIQRCIGQIKPDEFCNLAAQSFVGISSGQPLFTGDVDGMVVACILEAIRSKRPETRFYQASTSEMISKAQEPVQSEKTPSYPRGAYGVAKLYGHGITVNHRAFSLHVSSGILFNHESPSRGCEFVTRKIVSTFAEIACKSDHVLELGNLDA